ncbi:hypothetical protein AQUCO_02200238v1 [Aquilegia coerulea]|nr:hypothetical protein AQUCO_02200238v1 [Aquilegia coerulea]
MAGAHVIMACRNVNAANKIASMWREEVYNSRMPNVEVMELDLISISSVRRFADEWERRGEPLDILINNAGILKIEDAQRFTGDGIEEHMQVNHVAPALLTLLLLTSLRKAPSPRIINVSSVGHYSGVVEPQYWNSRIEEGKYNSMIAYGSSKLAHIMFLKVLAGKLLGQKQTSMQCFAVHPGAVCTNLNAGARMNLVFMFDGTEGARSVILCATSDSVTKNLVKGFAYYSCTCEPGKVSPKAEDMDSCFEIWQKTLDILDMKDDYLARLLDNQSN